MTSIPAVYTRAIAQESETTVVAIVEPTMREFSERQWDFASSESRASFNLLQTDTEAQPVVPRTNSWDSHDIIPFGTPHAPIFIDENNDFTSWPGEGSVEEPYIIAGLLINGSTPAINITGTDVHFVIKDCWLTSASLSVIELNSITHGRVLNNTILSGERGVVAYHSSDVTVYDNLFYSFGWAGVYLEDCSLSTLENNNCTTCFTGLHIEQSDNIFVEENYCTGCLGGIEIYLECEEITVFNNTLIDNDVGIGLYLDCTNNIIDSNNCTMNLVYGIYSQECQDNVILDNYGRGQIGDIVLENCTSHTISNNDGGETTGAGPDMVASIALYNTNNSIVTDNYVEHAFICIEMKWGSSYNEILDNTCFDYAGGVVSWFDAQHNTITNNTCNGGGVGEVDIFIQDSSYNTMTENRCNHSMFNIAVFDSNHSETVDNVCDLSIEAGIAFMGCFYLLVEGNTLTNGSSGIALDVVMYASVLDNSVTNFTGTWGGGPTGVHLTHAYNSSVEGNYITECNVAIMVDQSIDCNVTDNECIENFDGIVVVNSCYDVIVDDNYCHLQEGYALVVAESFDCVLTKNTCSNTSGSEGVCLLFLDCSANATENSFCLSTGGIDVQGNDGLITQNIIEDNELFGIRISGILGPNVTWNVFDNFGTNAFDASSTAIFDYNYYSNYTGVDSNADGIGDTGHPIDGPANNNDTHPIVYHPTLPVWSSEIVDQVSELGHDFQYVLDITTSTDLAPIVDWWVSDATHFVINDGTVENAIFLDLGEYPLEVKAINLYGFELSATFTLTVSDTIAPDIIGPVAFAYVVGQTGRTIAWIPEDYDPASYSVTLDGIEVMSGAWNSTTENVTISADGLAVGTHTFVVTFVDGSGNSATDTVVVTVLTDTTPLFLAIGAGGVVIAVIIVVYLIRKKEPSE
jgi:parallel beta-helix repeat protein